MMNKNELLTKKYLDAQSKNDIDQYAKKITLEKYAKELEFYLMVRFKEECFKDIETEKTKSRFTAKLPTEQLYYTNLATMASEIKRFEYITGIHVEVPHQYRPLFSDDVQYHRMEIPFPEYETLSAVRHPKNIAQFTIMVEGSIKLCTYNAGTEKITGFRTDCNVNDLQQLINFTLLLKTEVPEALLIPMV